MTVAVREKAALALSGCDSLTAFQNAHGENNLSFPILCSMRIHLAKRKTEDGGAAEPTAGRVIMVEAEDQDRAFLPNQSLLALGPILRNVPASTEELKSPDSAN